MSGIILPPTDNDCIGAFKMKLSHIWQVLQSTARPLWVALLELKHFDVNCDKTKIRTRLDKIQVDTWCLQVNILVLHVFEVGLAGPDAV